jgi:hypothetical protein
MASGDPIELARLAGAVGATGLLEGVEDGGGVAETALAALPHADDADLAMGRLGELALAAQPSELGPLLEAMLAIAGRPHEPREILDPEGMRAAARALLTLAAQKSLPRNERALAISAARALAEKGIVDPKNIPVDLDPADSAEPVPPSK